MPQFFLQMFIFKNSQILNRTDTIRYSVNSINQFFLAFDRDFDLDGIGSTEKKQFYKFKC